MFSSVGNWVRAFPCSYRQQLLQKYPNWILCLIAIHFCASYAKMACNLFQVSWIFEKHLTGTRRRPKLIWISQLELGLPDVVGKNKFKKTFLLFYFFLLNYESFFHELSVLDILTWMKSVDNSKASWDLCTMFNLYITVHTIQTVLECGQILIFSFGTMTQLRPSSWTLTV